MATAQQIYQQFCYDLAEDAGLVLGIVSPADFLKLLNLTLLDFFQRTGILQRIYTQSVFLGQGTYSIPDDLMEISNVFLAGRFLAKATQQELNESIRNWRRKQGIPKFWYTDGLPIKTIGLAPAPNYNGDYILGPNEPNPPQAVYDQFSALCQVGLSQVLLTAPQHRGLTLAATRKSNTQVAALGDPVPLIPDDYALSYLVFGVEQRFFSGDNECKDVQAAAFAGAQYDEGINLMAAIAGGSMGDANDGRG